MQGTPKARVRFGAFELDLSSGELHSGAETIQLQEQPFQVLRILIEHGGEIATREQIRKKLWPNDTVVEFDHSINAAVKNLRRALGDSAGQPAYIETVARRGYRLMVPVEWMESAARHGVALPLPPEPIGLQGRIVSHYRVLEVVGGGGMGVVYKAEDLKLGRRVALKFLAEEMATDPVALRRFEREARTASSLNHPNICTIYEIEHHEGQPFIVMELLEGQTLRDRLAAAAGDPSAPFSIDELLDLGIQLTKGLDAAHQAGIVHRDFKPANIFINKRAEAKILDFGLAKLAVEANAAPVPQDDAGCLPAQHEAAPGDLSLTRTGAAMGTAAYMSREQVRGEKVDARTDLFSFGLVLYEMATGHKAFSAETAPVLRDAILNRVPARAREWNPGLPPKLEEIIEKALEKDWARRYPSAQAMQAELTSLKQTLEPASASGKESAVRGAWLRMPRPAVVGGAFALLILAAIGSWLVNRRPPVPETHQLKQRQLTTHSGENFVYSGEISPDGRYLAYSDARGIHIKLLATGDIQNIPQPEQFRDRHVDWGVVWFPDSARFLATASVTGQLNTLWTVSVMGGAPRKLRDDAAGSFVSPDGGSIVFTAAQRGYSDREIWVMGSNGENAKKLDEAAQDSGFLVVRGAPDGRKVAYLKYQRTTGGWETVLESLDLQGGHRTTILAGTTPVRVRDFYWLPDGRMIYLVAEPDLNLRSCNLWEQKPDIRTGEPGGTLRPLTSWAGFCMDDLSATADGKRLAFKRWWVQRSVSVAGLDAEGMRITTPVRITHSESNDYPFAWTPGSDAVLFLSNRSGSWGIYRQFLQQEVAEPMATGVEDGVRPSISPDGAWILYAMPSKEPGSGTPLMRVPIAGGPPQHVMTARMGGQRCAKSPSAVCAIAERMPDGKQLIFTGFDPVKGRGRELTRFDIGPNASYVWDLSPDGARIAIHKSDDRRIHLLSTAGPTARELVIKGWSSFETLNWAADGKGLFAARRNQESSVLLYIDLRGNARIVWEQQGTLGNESAGTSGIPSPDGRHLAMMGFTQSANMWVIEGF